MNNFEQKYKPHFLIPEAIGCNINQNHDDLDNIKAENDILKKRLDKNQMFLILRYKIKNKKLIKISEKIFARNFL